MSTCIDVTSYGHPGSHPPSMITQDADNRFVTDIQITAWTDMADHLTVVTGNPHDVTKAEVGLGNCDDTSDADKPVSTAQQTALDLKTDNADYDVHVHNVLRNPLDTLTGLTVDSAGDVLLRAGGVSVNEFSSDGTLVGDSDKAVPTEKAIKQYVDAAVLAHLPTALTSPDGTPGIAFSADTSGRVFCVNGIGVDRFSDDGTLVGNSDQTIATERAVKTYVDNLQATFIGFRLRTPDSSDLNAFAIANDGRATFPTGVGVNEFSADGTLASNSDDKLSTEKAVKTYVDGKFVLGISQSLTFGGGVTGDVATMTITAGLVTAVTTVL